MTIRGSDKFRKKYSFADKSVWITGASSGIGLALARKIANTGAVVAVSARRESLLKELFADFPNVLVVAEDLTDRNANHKAVEEIISQHGRLDCAIFNAGFAQYVDCKNFDASIFEKMITTNYLSMVYGIEAVLPRLRQSATPYLVGMSSSVAWQGLPTGEAYSASKAAIANMLQGLRIELASDGIAVSAIFPGFVKTPLTDKNTFDMPFRISVEESADAIYRGLTRQHCNIHFPKRFTLLLKLIASLPDSLSWRLLQNTVPKQ